MNRNLQEPPDKRNISSRPTRPPEGSRGRRLRVLFDGRLRDGAVGIAHHGGQAQLEEDRAARLQDGAPDGASGRDGVAGRSRDVAVAEPLQVRSVDYEAGRHLDALRPPPQQVQQTQQVVAYPQGAINGKNFLTAAEKRIKVEGNREDGQLSEHMENRSSLTTALGYGRVSLPDSARDLVHGLMLGCGSWEMLSNMCAEFNVLTGDNGLERSLANLYFQSCGRRSLEDLEAFLTKVKSGEIPWHDDSGKGSFLIPQLLSLMPGHLHAYFNAVPRVVCKCKQWQKMQELLYGDGVARGGGRRRREREDICLINMVLAEGCDKRVFFKFARVGYATDGLKLQEIVASCTGLSRTLQSCMACCDMRRVYGPWSALPALARRVHD